MELLTQLRDSGSWVDFTQGLDARFINAETVAILKDIKIKRVHFAFDLMKNEDAIVRGLKLFKKVTGISQEKAIVYILTNFNTTYEQDMHRIKVVAECGYLPDVRIPFEKQGSL